MEIKQSILSVVFMLLLLQGTGAQQVFQASHYGKPGDQYLYNRFSPASFNDEISQAGENIIWDLTNQVGLHTHPVTVIEPSQGISQLNFLPICTLSGLTIAECSAVWSSTDQAVQLADSLHLLSFVLSDLQRYQAKVSTLLLENFIGFDVNIGGSPTHAVIVYQVPDTVLRFPIAYGDDWTSATRLGLDLNAAGEDIIYHSSQTRQTVIDGWGTLQTPYDTFENIIRLRSDILRLDTIIEQDTDFTYIVADQVEFMWLDTNYSLPVMTANGLILSNDSIVINQVEYLYDVPCPAPTWTVDIGSDVFYLDENGMVTINYNIEASNANIYSWDFGDGQFEVSDGSVSHVYSSPGAYSSVVQGCMTDCLPLNSCSFQIFDFVILDTLTSLVPEDGDQLGIKLYPNPADDQIVLYLPTGKAWDEFNIIDVNGRICRQGKVQDGVNRMSLGQLAAGLYTIHVKSSTTPTTRGARMRLMVNHP